ncbi:class II aldolase/adducin domain-containing protein [Mycena pura]|uniref:Class II aldolase/adducin domain-containing protein n=1 Tax=Mycena pura TaxID=153505 RepID=A0AAD6VDH1_9AGAR|nr:class II aldolase/adducin domain-containing protein [Mycena pura]
MTSASNDAQSDTFDLKGFRGKLPQPPVFPTKLEERDYLNDALKAPVRQDCFWVNPFGLHFKLIQPSDLLLVDHKGEIQDASGQKNGPFRILNTAAFMIHAAIHTKRPDVLCAAHSHSIYGKAFSIPSRRIPVRSTTCAPYPATMCCTSSTTVSSSTRLRAALAAALGTKKAAILQNHGLLVATSSIEATVHFYIALERACQVQLLANTAAAAHGGKTVHINPTQAAVTGRGIGSRGAGWFTGNTEFMVLEREEGVAFKSSA